MSAAATTTRAGKNRPMGGADRRGPRAKTSVKRPEREREVVRSEPASLEATLRCAWEDLASRGRAECLVCGDEMERAVATAAQGHCRACGAELS